MRKHCYLFSRTILCTMFMLVPFRGVVYGFSAKSQGSAVEERQKVSQVKNSEVRGVVTDSKTGEPLPGCAVKIKEAANGVVANIDGRFKLSDYMLYV